MRQTRIVEISGGTFPISVIISDKYGNNSTSLGVISSGPVPPNVTFNTTIPSILQTADEVLLTLIDANNCKTIHLLDCTYCIYQITITEL
jgi:hypothetical protein